MGPHPVSVEVSEIHDLHNNIKVHSSSAGGGSGGRNHHDRGHNRCESTSHHPAQKSRARSTFARTGNP